MNYLFHTHNNINNNKDPQNFKINIHRLASNIPSRFIGTIEEKKFPIDWPEAIEELQFIVPMVPKYFEYTKKLDR